MSLCSIVFFHSGNSIITSPYFRVLFIVVRLRPFPAVFNAMATACFWGLPAATSFLIFELITFLELPFLSGIRLAPFRG